MANVGKIAALEDMREEIKVLSITYAASPEIQQVLKELDNMIEEKIEAADRD